MHFIIPLSLSTISASLLPCPLTQPINSGYQFCLSTLQFLPKSINPLFLRLGRGAVGSGFRVLPQSYPRCKWENEKNPSHICTEQMRFQLSDTKETYQEPHPHPRQPVEQYSKEETSHVGRMFPEPWSIKERSVPGGKPRKNWFTGGTHESPLRSPKWLGKDFIRMEGDSTKTCMGMEARTFWNPLMWFILHLQVVRSEEWSDRSIRGQRPASSRLAWM